MSDVYYRYELRGELELVKYKVINEDEGIIDLNTHGGWGDRIIPFSANNFAYKTELEALYGLKNYTEALMEVYADAGYALVNTAQCEKALMLIQNELRDKFNV